MSLLGEKKERGKREGGSGSYQPARLASPRCRFLPSKKGLCNDLVFLVLLMASCDSSGSRGIRVGKRAVQCENQRMARTGPVPVPGLLLSTWLRQKPIKWLNIDFGGVLWESVCSSPPPLAEEAGGGKQALTTMPADACDTCRR